MSEYILAVDPGLRGCGFAHFVDGELKHAAYVVSPERTARGGRAWAAMAGEIAKCALEWIQPDTTLVVEYPVQYERSGGARDDISELTGVCGAIVGALTWCHGGIGIYTPRPADWKGQTPKVVHQKRIWSKLSDDEACRVVDDGAMTHNTVDAVGIGLWYLGRLPGQKAPC